MHYPKYAYGIIHTLSPDEGRRTGFIQSETLLSLNEILKYFAEDPRFDNSGAIISKIYQIHPLSERKFLLEK